MDCDFFFLIDKAIFKNYFLANKVAVPIWIPLQELELKWCLFKHLNVINT